MFTPRRVNKKAKINSAYFQENVLEPFNRHSCTAAIYLAILTVIRLDKVSNHTVQSTVAYMFRMARVNAIPFTDIHIKLPNLSWIS